MAREVGGRGSRGCLVGNGSYLRLYLGFMLHKSQNALAGALRTLNGVAGETRVPYMTSALKMNL